MKLKIHVKPMERRNLGHMIWGFMRKSERGKRRKPFFAVSRQRFNLLKSTYRRSTELMYEIITLTSQHPQLSGYFSSHQQTCEWCVYNCTCLFDVQTAFVYLLSAWRPIRHCTRAVEQYTQYTCEHDHINIDFLRHLNAAPPPLCSYILLPRAWDFSLDEFIEASRPGNEYKTESR